MARSRRKSKTPSRRDLRSDRGAFTLVELLVVIVILALLMALLVPSLRGVWARFHMTRCQTNLAHIYQAFRLRAADEAMGVKEAYAVPAWPSVLLPYLENDESQFKCPETSGALPTIIPEPTLRFFYPGKPWFTTLAEGPYVLKLSQTQYDDLKSKGYIVERKTVPPEFRLKYVPDSNPNLFWYCSEDWHEPQTDYDFEDIRVKVVNDGKGKVTMEFFKGVGYAAQLWDEGGKVLVNPVVTGATYTYEMNVEASYGMNSYARDVGGAGGKILVMDYLLLVASTNNNWKDSFFDPNKSDLPLFARHFGMANVLFSDGSVRAERPEDIDPITSTVAKRWWEP